MKILLRQYQGESLVWVDAEIRDQYSYIIKDKQISVNQTDVVSVIDNDANKYVKCSACGEIVRNTRKAIKEHQDKGKCSSTCFGCGYMRQSNKIQTDVKYKLLEDGKYLVTTKQNVKLYCNNVYGYPDINSEKARNSCKYKGCITSEMQPLNDFFSSNPGAFDDMITVDAIVANGFTSRRESSYGTLYALKAKNSIDAAVNKFNIVDKFRVSFRNNSYWVYYSKKYDKLYHERHGKYEVLSGIYGMSANSFNNMKEKIKSLYN